MKKCPYCRNEYPDDVTVCPMDGESLSARRKKVAGVWRGKYGYGPRESLPGCGPAAFTLKLKQGWTAHFTGTVSDDSPPGEPGTGTIDGYFNHPTIEFTKRMPVGHVIKEDGTRITLREYLIEGGHACQRELPGPPILYRGTFLDADRVQGTWTMQSLRIPLPGGSALSLPPRSGFWCAQFVSEDAKVNPTGGPAEALFDKSLLTPEEVEDVKGLPPCSLGKFTVADADKLIERLAHAGILCRFNRDDSDMREMMPLAEVTGGLAGTAAMMEIFVSPDDEARAQEIVGKDNPV